MSECSRCELYRFDRGAVYCMCAAMDDHNNRLEAAEQERRMARHEYIPPGFQGQALTDYRDFLAAMRGILPWTVAQVMNQIDTGVDYRGCSMRNLAEAWGERNTHINRIRLTRVTLAHVEQKAKELHAKKLREKVLMNAYQHGGMLYDALKAIATLHIVGPMTSEQGRQLTLITNQAQEAVSKVEGT